MFFDSHVAETGLHSCLVLSVTTPDMICYRKDKATAAENTLTKINSQLAGWKKKHCSTGVDT